MNTIDPGWILMENQSTDDVFGNPRLVQNIRHTVGHYITIHCNSVNRRVMEEATLKGYGTAWFDEVAISNILSYSRIRYKYPVHYETEVNYFSIIKPYKEVLFR